ncbi:MAG: hypothetical protein RIS64_3672, partial [Bacteroidota bacterium]
RDPSRAPPLFIRWMNKLRRAEHNAPCAELQAWVSGSVSWHGHPARVRRGAALAKRQWHPKTLYPTREMTGQAHFKYRRTLYFFTPPMNEQNMNK